MIGRNKTCALCGETRQCLGKGSSVSNWARRFRGAFSPRRKSKAESVISDKVKYGRNNARISLSSDETACGTRNRGTCCSGETTLANTEQKPRCHSSSPLPALQGTLLKRSRRLHSARNFISWRTSSRVPVIHATKIRRCYWKYSRFTTWYAESIRNELVTYLRKKFESHGKLFISDEHTSYSLNSVEN